jgi:hypothetical protein
MNIKTTCAECGTPLWGIGLHKRNDAYYCSADFERLSPEEDIENKKKEKQLDNYKELFDGTGIEELVTNGSFSSDTGWTKGTGWTISSNVASCDGTQSAESLLTQVRTKVIHVEYIYTFTISNYSAGTIAVRYGTSYTGTSRSANGTYTETLRQLFEYNNNALAADSSFVGSIDNFSVRRKKT